MTQLYPWRTILLDEVDSTNRWLLKRYLPYARPHLAVMARSQTSGRGRGGADWIGIRDGSLLCSTLHSVSLDLPLGLLSLVGGLALVEAVAELGVTQAGLKWPNDLVLVERKLGGVLIEGQVQGSDYRCVIGVGVNVVTPTLVDQPVAGLLEYLDGEPATIVRTLAGRYLERLSYWEERFQEGDASSILAGYRGRCLTIGRHVKVETPQGERQGQIQDVLSDGSLLLVDRLGEEVALMPESSRHLRYILA